MFCLVLWFAPPFGTACLSDPTTTSTDAEVSVIAVTALDPRGQPTPLEAIVRRPILEIRTSVALSANGPPVFLFDGSLDPELVTDLTQPPLRITHEARLLPVSIAVEQHIVRVIPVAPLRAGQTITLAIGAWAVADTGERWTSDEPFIQPLRVTSAPDAGASAIASWPAHGASGVAPNLAFAAIGFDGALESIPDQLHIESIDRAHMVTATTERVDCDATGLNAHTCVRLQPERELHAITTYAIALTDSWSDATGSPVEPWEVLFTTAESLDSTAPHSSPLPCAIDEATLDVGCALVSDTTIQFRVAANEATLITWQTIDCAPTTIAAFSAEASFTLGDLLPEGDQLVRLEFADAAGNTRAFEERITTHATIAELTISEVRADPFGPEPQQEYVELANYGNVAIDLRGYSVSDDAFEEGDVIERSVWLHPGGRALLVADDFDPNDPRDTAPAPGAMLIRVGGSIAGGGLSNSGEPVFLRDPSGGRVSQTPTVASAGAGVCLQRRDLHSRDGSLNGFVHDADHACTPGL